MNYTARTFDETFGERIPATSCRTHIDDGRRNLLIQLKLNKGFIAGCIIIKYMKSITL